MPIPKRRPTAPKPAVEPTAPPAPPLTGPPVADTGADLEGFLSEDRKSDAKFTRGPRKFKDQILAEYSTGVRLLWLNLMNDGDSSQMLGACMVWLLIQLEVFRSYAAKQLSDPEAIWDAAHTSLLLLVDNRVTSRAKVINWATRLTKKELNQTVRLSNEIMDEADAEEVESDPEQPPDASGLPKDAILSRPGN